MAAEAVELGGAKGGRVGVGAVEPAPSQGAMEAAGLVEVRAAEPRAVLDRADGAREEPSRGGAR